MIGHSGAFGTVLFHIPERDLYVSGTVNQMRPRSLPYPLLLKLVAQFRCDPSQLVGSVQVSGGLTWSNNQMSKNSSRSCPETSS